MKIWIAYKLKVIRNILYHLAIEKIANILIRFDLELFVDVELESMDDIKLVATKL